MIYSNTKHTEIVPSENLMKSLGFVSKVDGWSTFDFKKWNEQKKLILENKVVALGKELEMDDKEVWLEVTAIIDFEVESGYARTLFND